MKLLFLATPDVPTYLGQDVRAYHGNVVQVNQQRGMKLLEFYPHNFFPIPVGIQKLGSPVHQPTKVSDITVLTIHYWPQEVLEKCLLSYLPEEVEFIKLDNENNKNFSSGAQALNYGVRKARNDVVICAHEDLVFRKGWFESFIKQECRLKRWGALGIVGMGFDRRLHWGSNYDVPYKIMTLDECCLILNRKNGIWFDEATFKGWHCYGVDFCLQARNKGLNVYVVSGPATHGDRIRGYRHSKDWYPALELAHELIKKKWGKIFPSIVTSTGVLQT